MGKDVVPTRFQTGNIEMRDPSERKWEKYPIYKKETAMKSLDQAPPRPNGTVHPPRSGLSTAEIVC